MSLLFIGLIILISLGFEPYNTACKNILDSFEITKKYITQSELT